RAALHASSASGDRGESLEDSPALSGAEQIQNRFSNEMMRRKTEETLERGVAVAQNSIFVDGDDHLVDVFEERAVPQFARVQRFGIRGMILRMARHGIGSPEVLTRSSQRHWLSPPWLRDF